MFFGRAMGPGKADLLEAIERHGSISAAAREMGMSYRRAWMLVDSMNHSFGQTLVDTATGGQGGGGASITDAGRDVLRRYRKMQSKAETSIQVEMNEFAELAGRDKFARRKSKMNE
ncbi:MAG TPA: LysR family transcriptional regulator [Burkholderiales bacterium]|nr:LysR family transcriptional regulator [Burkholderiales bacterium]